MNRSITRKALLVLMLVTLIGAGGLAQSGNGNVAPTATQISMPATGWVSVSDPADNYRHSAGGDPCPYHRNTTSRKAPAYMRSVE